MKTAAIPLPAEQELDAPTRIKVAARRLFAERGVDGVSTREIVRAAGQKNQGALNYYFGTKEALVREIVADGAKRIDDRRNRWLDALEAQGGPREIIDITDILVFASVRVSRAGKFREDSYTRFVTLLSQSHRELFEQALENKWNSGYQRCLSHLRRLMPDMPKAIKKQRFVFIGAALGAILSMREAALSNQLDRPGEGSEMWTSDQTLRHVSATMAAMLSAPHDPEGLATPHAVEIGRAPRG